jgi:hypothetical protein
MIVHLLPGRALNDFLLQKLAPYLLAPYKMPFVFNYSSYQFAAGNPGKLQKQKNFATYDRLCYFFPIRLLYYG